MKPAISAHAASRSSVCSIIGLPASGRYCLGMSAPKRRPAPAAGTMHQRRSVAAIVVRLRRGLGRLHALVERLAWLQQPELGARALLDGLVAVLEIVDLGLQRLVARLQLRV